MHGSKSKLSKVAKKTFSGLILSAFVLVFILLFLIVIWHVRRHQTSETCLCFHDDVGLKYGFENPELHKNCTLEYHNGKSGTFNCVKGFNALKNIALKELLLHYDTEINTEPPLVNVTIINCTISQERPALLHLKDIRKIDTKGKSKIILWQTVMSDGDGLRYIEKDGMVTIQRSGFFHISTQLTGIKEHNATEEQNHFVIRISDTTEQKSVLLERTNSPCQMPVEQCEQSSNIAAVFRLEKNDKIYVAISNPLHVLLENGKSFFSIYEI